MKKDGCSTGSTFEVFSGFLAEVSPIFSVEDLACYLAGGVFGFAGANVLGSTRDLFLS